jgi:exodeoxyribonuclease VII large subunit
MAGRRESRDIYSVSELAEILRGLLEDALPGIWVQGEISNFRNPSGHWYFTLKDAGAQVRCAMFKGRNLYVRPVPRDGDAVLVRGTVSFYTARGDLQIIVEQLEPAGEGALLRAFEALKKKLAAEGLFDEALKRPLPKAPRGIGLITSPTGAALQDMLTTLRRRYPVGTVYLSPVPVQGDAATPAIVEALAELPRRAPVDVVLLARGGGSLEDLWAFNDERIARAIRACPVPVVTGIGHETDFTIADFASDLRAPTPTGAAERVSPDVTEWLEQVRRFELQLARAQREHAVDAAQKLQRLKQRLDLAHPGRRLQQFQQRLDELGERLTHAGPQGLARRRESLGHLQLRLRSLDPSMPIARLHERLEVHGQRLRLLLAGRLQALRERIEARESLLNSLGPRAVLERGYAIVQNAAGEVIRDSAQLKPGDTLETALAKGHVQSEVRKVTP